MIITLTKSQSTWFLKNNHDKYKLNTKNDQVVLNRVDYFNFLGLTNDSQMTWKKHTDNISNTCLRVIGTLNRIKHILPTQTRIMLYNYLILPHINYCIMAWGYQSNRVFKLQQRANIIVANSKYNAHTFTLSLSLSSSFPFVRGEVLPATFSPPHLIVFSTLLCLLSSSSSLPPRLPSSHLS